MKTAIYARVSTDDQTTDNQIPALVEWATRRGFILGEIYQEHASAWAENRQTELPRLLDDARKRKFDLVIVWALDRLTRQGVGRIFEYIKLFKSYGVKIYSYQEPWTEAPGGLGDILFSITAWAAQYESDRRSVNTRAGIETRRAKGLRIGRPPGSQDRRKRKQKAKRPK